MSSKKLASEGIALLSMYNDEEEEDEEMEDVGEARELEGRHREEEEIRGSNESVNGTDSEGNTPLETSVHGDGNYMFMNASSTPELQVQLPVVLAGGLDGQRSRKEKLAIVDYGHDEVAMSPEAEEGEIESRVGIMARMELQNTNGNIQEKTSPATVQILTPGVATPQTFEHQEHSRADTLNSDINESAVLDNQQPVKDFLEEPNHVNPLDRFLPSPPEQKCKDTLQWKINKFISLKKEGRSFNAAVRNNKDYRNPDFLLRAVSYLDIDQIGSCFSKTVFDPHGYDSSDYYDALEVGMKREVDRKEQERKRSQKVDFVAGVNQPGSVASVGKITLPITGMSTVGSTGFYSHTPADVPRDGRQNKKSKWDKVDGDGRNPLPSSGKDSVSVGTHATLLSASNAGAGYTAFAQQRRREAEEKRSSERNFDRRS